MRDPNKLLAKFNPHPSPSIQKKVEYFFLPYNSKVLGLKHMRFDSDKEVSFDMTNIKEE